MPLAPSNHALLRHWPTPPLLHDCIGNTWRRSRENSVCPTPARPQVFAWKRLQRSPTQSRGSFLGSSVRVTIIFTTTWRVKTIFYSTVNSIAPVFSCISNKKLSMVKVTRLLFSWKDPVNVISKDWVETEEGDEGSFGALPRFPLSCTIWPRLFKLSTR